MTEIRKRVLWKKYRTPADWIALFISTGAGSGLLPLMPGTWGSLAALPLAWWLNQQPDFFRVAFTVGLFLVSVWAASRFDAINETGDNQHTVVDEVLGTIICAWFAGTYWPALFIAFGLFRFFDIVKPWPVRLVDHWSKTASKKSGNIWIGGFGVIMDDVVAGFQGLLVYWIFSQIRPF